MGEGPRTHSNIFLGLILIALGVIFSLSTFDVYDFGDLIGTWWPVILIVIGLKKLMSPGEPRFGGGFIVLIIGVIFLLFNLDILEWRYIWYLWPLVLILIGLRMVFSPRQKLFSSKTDFTGDTIDTVAIFGGSDLVVSSQDFKGGKATALFGGVDIDLRGAGIGPEGATLQANAFFGGVDLRIPAGWNVIVEGTPLFGAIESKCAAAAPDAPQLVIKGSAVFGGVEVKN